MNGAVILPPRTASPIHFGASRANSEADRWGRRLVVLIVCVWTVGLFAGHVGATAVLAATGAALAITGLLRPTLGLLGLAMLCPLDPLVRVFLTGGWLPWNAFNYLLLLLVLVHMPLICSRREPPVVLKALLSILLLLQLSYSPLIENGAQSMLNASSFYGLLVYFLRNRGNARAWYWFGLVGGTMGACAGLYGMSRGMWMNANGWAYLPLTAMFTTCLAFPMSAAYRHGGTTLQLLAATNLCWVYLTGSRGSFLVGLVCAMFLFTQERRLERRTLIVCAAAFVGVAALAMFSSLQERALYRIQKLFDAERTLKNRTSGRSELAVVAWQVFQQHPLGVGTGGFPRYWSQYNLQDYVGERRAREKNAHSAWAMTLADNGVPGIALLLAFTSSFAVAGWRRRSCKLLPVGLLATFVLATAFLSTEFTSKGIWMVAAGATVLLYHRLVDARSGQAVWPPRQYNIVMRSAACVAP